MWHARYPVLIYASPNFKYRGPVVEYLLFLMLLSPLRYSRRFCTLLSQPAVHSVLVPNALHYACRRSTLLSPSESSRHSIVLFSRRSGALLLPLAMPVLYLSSLAQHSRRFSTLRSLPQYSRRSSTLRSPLYHSALAARVLSSRCSGSLAAPVHLPLEHSTPCFGLRLSPSHQQPSAACWRPSAHRQRTVSEPSR